MDSDESIDRWTTWIEKNYDEAGIKHAKFDHNIAL